MREGESLRIDHYYERVGRKNMALIQAEGAVCHDVGYGYGSGIRHLCRVDLLAVVAADGGACDQLYLFDADQFRVAAIFCV